MRIYVDFDDCLCETARAFSKLLALNSRRLDERQDLMALVQRAR